ncbi:MAG: hypothetical protein NUW37_09415 [Planctomycetes bacterium]|nr:hypothetical protein [Planctomycetota bacterium]
MDETNIRQNVVSFQHPSRLGYWIFLAIVGAILGYPVSLGFSYLTALIFRVELLWSGSFIVSALLVLWMLYAIKYGAGVYDKSIYKIEIWKDGFEIESQSGKFFEHEFSGLKAIRVLSVIGHGIELTLIGRDDSVRKYLLHHSFGQHAEVMESLKHHAAANGCEVNLAGVGILY